MDSYKMLEVFLGAEKVGTLAQTRENTFAFEYDDSWLINGFSVSPFSLPLRKQVFLPKHDPFDGLFGAFTCCRSAGSWKAHTEFRTWTTRY